MAGLHHDYRPEKDVALASDGILADHRWCTDTKIRVSQLPLIPGA
jgi:hypothetical protein